ncbi:MAG TPA: MoxR family ATPase [Polyangiales bacterium]|nr:MoxR family ATPase [Polyangiales bacterium]
MTILVAVGTTVEQLGAMREAVKASIVGQEEVIENLLLALLCNGHALLEGLPGLGKTRAVKVLAGALGTELHRVQFTPDLLPSDVMGSVVYHSESGTGQFRFEPGPIFGHLVLIDEINRAPAKVQSALLEAMEEHQVTAGGETHPLPDPFFVLATQNPIEQEGTYPLPEAQLDRFLLHIAVGYPNVEAELSILRLVRGEEKGVTRKVAGSVELLTRARQEISERVRIAENMERYIVDLVAATRAPKKIDAELAQWIELGVSPRASLALDKVSRARAYLAGRDYVTADDVRSVAPAVLRHRLILGYEAKAKGVTADQVVARLLDRVAIAG